MAGYIARVIIKDAEKSIEEGRMTYKRLLVNFKLYAPYHDEVDAILTMEGYAAVITE